MLLVITNYFLLPTTLKIITIKQIHNFKRIWPITSNNRSFSWPVIWTYTVRSAFLFIDTSIMLDTSKLIRKPYLAIIAGNVSQIEHIFLEYYNKWAYWITIQIIYETSPSFHGFNCIHMVFDRIYSQYFSSCFEEISSSVHSTKHLYAYHFMLRRSFELFIRNEKDLLSQRDMHLIQY